MPFDFTCPFCHTKTKVDDKYAGKSGNCVGCGKRITLPLNSGPASDQDRLSSNVGSFEDRASRKWMVASIAISIVAGLILSLGIVFTYSYPHLRRTLIVNAQKQDLIKMQRIATALNAYYDRYQSYPPPTVRDANGKTLYSWRVLILPQLGYDHIYNQFVLDQPFDSPANLNAANSMPTEYRSVVNFDSDDNEASFALLTGTGTMFPPDGPLRKVQIDQPTLLLVDFKSGGKLWSEPGDVDSTSGLRPGNRPNKDLGGTYSDDFLAVSVDEQRFSFPNTVPGVIIDALVSPHGAESVDYGPFLITK